MKTLLLKAIKQIVYRFSERTPPQVKYSARNNAVAMVCFNIDGLIAAIRK